MWLVAAHIIAGTVPVMGEDYATEAMQQTHWRRSGEQSMQATA